MLQRILDIEFCISFKSPISTPINIINYTSFIIYKTFCPIEKLKEEQICIDSVCYNNHFIYDI